MLLTPAGLAVGRWSADLYNIASYEERDCDAEIGRASVGGLFVD